MRPKKTYLSEAVIRKLISMAGLYEGALVPDWTMPDGLECIAIGMLGFADLSRFLEEVGKFASVESYDTRRFTDEIIIHKSGPTWVMVFPGVAVMK